MPSQPRLEILKPKELVILIIYYKVLWLPGRGRGGKKKGVREGGRATAARCFVVKSKQEMNEFFSGIIRQCANVLPRPTARPTPPPSNRKTQSQTAFTLTSCLCQQLPPLALVIKYCLVRKEKLFNAPLPLSCLSFSLKKTNSLSPWPWHPPLARSVLV